MSEQNPSKKRKGKRRFFRSKRGKEGAPSTAKEPEAKPAEVKVSVRRSRKAQRRSRQRQRQREEANVEVMRLEGEDEYNPPESVFVYTHALYPDVRDTATFRPEHFSHVGRTLDDYQIDLTKLFDEERPGPDGLPTLLDLSTTSTFSWEEWEDEENNEAP